MSHVSRAGRKQQIYRIMAKGEKQSIPYGWTVGSIAKKLGLKSSTHLKNILREMATEYEQITIQERSFGDVFLFHPMTQTDFLDRVIIINNKPITVRDEVHSLLRLS